MSQINREIGDFTVQAYHNGKFETVSKQDVLGKWSIFFFYPADFTFVCPTELEELADNYEAFKAAASDRIKKIQYVMLADPAHVLSRDFEVLIEQDGMAERGSFIVNPQGKITACEVISGSVGRSATELLRRLQACQFVAEHGNEVCPAGWKPGAATLKPSLDLVGQL